VNAAKAGFGFEITARMAGDDGIGRAGIIRTPHGPIQTPAFIPVGTKATVKTVLPETMAELGAQALLANAYHLYLQPGADIVQTAGGLAAFMNWSGPTFTDSGGFQVLSLGAGFKKVLAMDTDGRNVDDVVAEGKDRLALVDDDGVTFTSHLDGSQHRFTAEVSMRVQQELGADIIFAFDECTTLMNSVEYQQLAMDRTLAWAHRCIAEHRRLTVERGERPYQALFGVVQGAQYEDLRRQAARDIGALEFDGFGIGGAIEKENMAAIVRWVSEELPEGKPRHLLGIGEPRDFFTAIESGADTFDCVSPARVARNAALYTFDGRFNVNTSANRRNFGPVDEQCGCYTCRNYTRAYLHHAFKAKESIAATLATIHNEHFIVSLVDRIRRSIEVGEYVAFRDEFLARYPL
jgi:queuine tRNA-ribosyltransferase